MGGISTLSKKDFNEAVDLYLEENIGQRHQINAVRNFVNQNCVHKSGYVLIKSVAKARIFFSKTLATKTKNRYCAILDKIYANGKRNGLIKKQTKSAQEKYFVPRKRGWRKLLTPNKIKLSFVLQDHGTYWTVQGVENPELITQGNSLYDAIKSLGWLLQDIS